MESTQWHNSLFASHAPSCSNMLQSIVDALHLLTQIDTSILLSLLFIECQERCLCRLVSLNGKHPVLRYVYWLCSDIHCQYWKSIMHVTCTIDFQYGQWISERSHYRMELLGASRNMLEYCDANKPNINYGPLDANDLKSVRVACTFCTQHLRFLSLQRSNIYLSRFKCKHFWWFHAKRMNH